MLKLFFVNSLVSEAARTVGIQIEMDFIKDLVLDWKDSTVVRSVVVGGIVVAISYGLYRRWVRGNVCVSRASVRERLGGKVAVITGANSGIGLETAVGLAQRGARVILACRDVDKGIEAERIVKRRSGNQDVSFMKLDLASLSSVRLFAQTVIQTEKTLDILVNNAGVALTSCRRTRDGFEMHLGVNHLGHFLLTNLLLDLMKSTPGNSRIVNVASSLYKRCLEFDFGKMNSDDPSRYNSVMPGKAYSQSKLANILFTRSLCQKLEGCGVSTCAVCPGMVMTGLIRDYVRNNGLFRKIILWVVFYLLVKTPWQGAQTILYCSMAKELEGVSGRMYSNCREKRLETSVAKDDQVAEELWKVSAKMVGLETS